MGVWGRWAGQWKLDQVTRRLVRGISWTTAGNLVSSAATLISAILLARAFGPSRFGEFGVVQNTVGYFGVLVGPSLGMTATRYVAQLRIDDPLRLARILRLISIVTTALALGLAVLLLLFSPLIASGLFRAPELAGDFRAGAVILFLMAVNGIQVGTIIGFESFQAAAMVNVGRGIATLPALWLGGTWFGPEGALWGLAASWMIACILSAFYYRRLIRRFRIPRGATGIWQESNVLLDFSAPGWLGGIVAGVANSLGILILSRQPQGMEQTGILNASNQLFLILMFLPQIVNQVAFPILSERSRHGENSRGRALLWRLTALNLAVTLPWALGLSLLSPFIMQRFGEGFTQGWPVLTLTLWAVPAYALSLLTQSQLAAHGRMWTLVSGNVAYLLVFVGGNLALVRHGALGFAFARILAFMVMYGLMFWRIKVLEGVPQQG